MCAAHITTSKASLWKRNVLFDCHVMVLLKLFETGKQTIFQRFLKAILAKAENSKHLSKNRVHRLSQCIHFIYLYIFIHIHTQTKRRTLRHFYWLIQFKKFHQMLSTHHHLPNKCILAQSHNNEYALLISIFYSKIKDRKVKLTWVGRFFWCCRCCCSLVIHLSCLFLPSKSMCLYMPRACLTHTLSPSQSQKASVAKTLLKWNKETRKRP